MLQPQGTLSMEHTQSSYQCGHHSTRAHLLVSLCAHVCLRAHTTCAELTLIHMNICLEFIYDFCIYANVSPHVGLWRWISSCLQQLEILYRRHLIGRIQ